jgi:hypothetical protein
MEIGNLFLELISIRKLIEMKTWRVEAIPKAGRQGAGRGVADPEREA